MRAALMRLAVHDGDHGGYPLPTVRVRRHVLRAAWMRSVQLHSTVSCPFDVQLRQCLRGTAGYIHDDSVWCIM